MQHNNSQKAKIIIQILGDIVREERVKLGKSQRLIADEYGVEKSLINRMENCKNEAKIISIFTVSEVLGMKTSELIRKIEERLPKDFSVLEE